MYMRIISGIRRGHKLLEFQGYDVRPTTDRVKESIFNLIQIYIPQAKVLDMFAGSGALSFEAVSRGADCALLLDSDSRSVELIKRNIADLKFEDKCKVVKTSCFDYLCRCNEQFDVIFLDPPYNKGFIDPALKGIIENDILSSEGIIVLESDSTDFSAEADGLEMINQKRYGRTFVTVYQRAV